jgi:hypothetical protein
MGSNAVDRRTNEQMIIETLDLLHQPGDIVELRMLNTTKGTVSGYFDDFKALANVATQASGKVPSVYVTLNPARKDLLARSSNRVKAYVKTTTADADIIKRCWLGIDVDPVRPKDISSTEAEHELALNKANKIIAFLTNQGWPDPILADSGNGGHLLYKIDLPNDEVSRALLRRCLEALDFVFSDEKLSIDRCVHNAARIWKLYGTMACKGDNIPERPYRLARILEVPKEITIVILESLQNLAAMLPEMPGAESNPVGSYKPFDLEAWMTDHGLSTRRTKPWQGGTVYELSECPFNSGHNNGEARIIQFSTGALSFGCFHNACQGNDWFSLRDKLEPGWRERRNGDGLDKSHSESLSYAMRPSKPKIPWPEPLAHDVYYGLAGEIVRTIEPHSEADPVALLVNFLTAFGNIIADKPHFKVEADKHPMRLFCALVGETSKARKGTSWGYLKNIFGGIDPTWKEHIQTGLSSGEGLIWAVRDEITKRQPIKEKGRVSEYEEVVIDQGIEDKRVLIVEGEFASTLRVLGRDGNTLSAVIRNAWDTGDLQTLTKNSPAKATGAHVSLIVHITRQELLRYLTSIEAGNGFGNRFLWFCVKRSKSLPFGGGVHKVNFEHLIKRLKETVEFAKAVVEITWAENTRSLWAEIYPELSEGKSGLIGALTARGEAYVTRLACVYALLDLSTRVKPEHLKAALAIWDYVEASVRYLFQDATGDPLANDILEALTDKPEGITRTEIYKYFNHHKSSEQIETSLELLYSLGKVRKETLTTEGRPGELWILN